MSSTTGLVLHHLEDSRSQRVLWLLVRIYMTGTSDHILRLDIQEELEVPYTLKVNFCRNCCYGNV
jgi:hypothetical protein